MSLGQANNKIHQDLGEREPYLPYLPPKDPRVFMRRCLLFWVVVHVGWGGNFVYGYLLNSFTHSFNNDS